MDSETIEALAAQWLTRSHDETWTEANQQELESWLDESTHHRVAYLRLKTVWHQTARLKALGAGVPAGVIPPPGFWRRGLLPQSSSTPEEREYRRISVRRWVGIAATVVSALVAGIYLIVLQLQRPERYDTAVGAVQTIHLADNSEVTLNTNTHIRVYLQNRERRVDLDSGEAYFVVTRDRDRPFVIRVGDKRITAVGTAFCVRRAAAEVSVVVTQGRVRLTSSFAKPSDRTTTLDAGTMARTSQTEVLVQPASEEETEQLLGWRAGFVIFRDTRLADAVAEFNRYRDKPVVIADPSIASIRIGGKFRINNIDGFLELLEQGFPVSVERSSNGIVLKGRR